MTIVRTPDAFDVDDLYIDIGDWFGMDLLIKCEGLNFPGSIKLKPARRMIDEAERSGRLVPGSRIIESSSGNIAIALATIAASRGYGFTCVTDSHCNQGIIHAIRALGGTVEVVTEPSGDSGFLAARLARVAQRLREDPDLVWLNQYANENNWLSHYDLTARQIATQCPGLTTLFVGAGTTGTLRGCAAYMHDHRPDVAVIGVDSVGSVTFGGPASVRMLPGLGSGVPVPQLDMSLLAGTVYVPEATTVDMARRLASHGFLFGASTCTVMAGVECWIREHGRPSGLAVIVSPDLGGQYCNTLYDPEWTARNIPGAVPVAEPDAVRPHGSDSSSAVSGRAVHR